MKELTCQADLATSGLWREVGASVGSFIHIEIGMRGENVFQCQPHRVRAGKKVEVVALNPSAHVVGAEASIVNESAQPIVRGNCHAVELMALQQRARAMREK
jgi:hypothetical protein